MAPETKHDGPPEEPRRRVLRAIGWTLLAGGALTLAGPGLARSVLAAPGRPLVTLYKSPWCGCCAKWGRHMEGLGFEVTIHNRADLDPVKAKLGVPAALASCHTALVEGYVIEGHVPGDLVQRLLAERPPVAGLAVPGMPSSSPGMDQPTGERYDVLAFDKDGRTALYARR